MQQLIDLQILYYETHIVASLRDNPKRYWSYVNGKLANKNKCFNAIKTSQGTINDPEMIAEEMNNFFYSSFNKRSNDTHGTIVNSNDRPIGSLLSDIEINFYVVKSVIKFLPIKSSEDSDGFSYFLLKEGGDMLAYQLNRLFRLSFSTGMIPRDWKKSVIIPIKKKLSSIRVEDFRPINIISCICSVFERIIRSEINHFLSVNESLKKSQHGFVKGRSTATARLPYSDDVSMSLDKGLCVDVAYFDFSKAFDSVRHDYLIHKLFDIGISGALLKWIINYLHDRTQVVNIRGVISTKHPVTSGVIQGSVLGPIFSPFLSTMSMTV